MNWSTTLSNDIMLRFPLVFEKTQYKPFLKTIINWLCPQVAENSEHKNFSVFPQMQGYYTFL